MSTILAKIAATLVPVAPTIATALGGPLAGMAVSVLVKALGLDAKAAESDIAKSVLSMSPETAASLRKADQDFAVKMRELDIDVERLAEADRESARTMQTSTRDWTPRVLAVAIVAGFFGLLAAMAFVSLPAANHDALMMLLGALAAAFAAVCQFYYGSSIGSHAKDDLIKELSR